MTQSVIERYRVISVKYMKKSKEIESHLSGKRIQI